MRICVYPGTFDPITNGHLDLICRATQLFDKVIVAIAQDNYKKFLLSNEERYDLLCAVTQDLANVEIEIFNGLLMDFCRQKKAQAVVRGLRAISDYEYELQMALMNKHLNEEVETVFLMSSQHYSFISSSLIKNVAKLGGDVSEMVPPVVLQKLTEMFTPKQKS